MQDFKPRERELCQWTYAVRSPPWLGLIFAVSQGNPALGNSNKRVFLREAARAFENKPKKEAVSSKLSA